MSDDRFLPSNHDRTTSWEAWHRLIDLFFEARSVEMAGP
jgi:hypothetical protein